MQLELIRGLCKLRCKINRIDMSSHRQIRRAFRDLDKHFRLQKDGIAFDVARFNWTDQLEVEVTEHLLRNDMVSAGNTPELRRHVPNFENT